MGNNQITQTGSTFGDGSQRLNAQGGHNIITILDQRGTVLYQRGDGGTVVRTDGNVDHPNVYGTDGTHRQAPCFW